MNHKILVVEDDHVTLNLLKMYLDQEGYSVLLADNGRQGLELARQKSPDLILLDLMLPKVDGLDVCRILRAESQVPIIMLTARSTEDDMLLGLDLGADDYIRKPFSPREVVARVRALLRRVTSEGGQASDALEIGEMTINFRRREVRVDGAAVQLTAKEYRLLEVLAREPGRIFTRGELLDYAFRLEDDVLERTVDFHIMNLRRKLEGREPDRQLVQTVHGLGYKLAEADDVD